MGQTHLFECSKCGYTARVAGGTEEGEHFTVQTIACADCKALYDAVVQAKTSLPQRSHPSKNAPKFATVLNRLPPRGAHPWLKFKPACPVSARHRIRGWKPPDKCPKCGSFLEQSAVSFRVWD